MAEENQITLFTDFDNTIIAEHAAKRLLFRLFQRNPLDLAKKALEAFFRYGVSGAAFIQAISSLDKKTRTAIVEDVVPRLTFNTRWIRELQKLLTKYPNVMNIKIVVITRNIADIPRLFMQLHGNEIRELTKGRYKGDLVVIGNEGLSQSVLYAAAESLTVADIINNSREKVRFIKNKNAIFFGDDEEYRQIVGKTNLKNLLFFRV